MNDNTMAPADALELWAEESVNGVAADCCVGSGSTGGTASSPILSFGSAGCASSECP
ncbi:hypothetical protein AB5J62_12860 [Amycolatopsis sp. cg5]|uniref:hypothetical protein n=1 Tax=Amycolatopsis sp. cg5 TaxID=3238802 RepID=UPI003525CDD7